VRQSYTKPKVGRFLRHGVCLRIIVRNCRTRHSTEQCW